MKSKRGDAVLGLLCAMTFAVSPIPAAVADPVEVLDGDTIRIGDTRVRLFGIDAPEGAQTCDDGQWSPGPLARQALVDFIGARSIECRQVDFDRRYQRPVSLCFAGEDDLQAFMVGAGWAWAYLQFSSRYADAERRAAARGVGVHAHKCEKPWEWRARSRGAR